MRSEPPTTSGSKGQIVLHPALIEIRNTHREIAQLLCRIDLAPFDDDTGGSIRHSDFVGVVAVGQGA